MKLLFSLLAVFAVCAPRVLAAERVALVIGNSRYAHIAKLKNPVNDARALGQTLKGLGFDVIQIEEATTERFYEGLEAFKSRVSGARVGLVYFAGHGVEIDGKNYLLPVDAQLANPGQLRTQTVALESVLGDLDDTGLSAKIVILDCCRDDPFTQAWMATRSSGVGGLAALKDVRFPAATMVMFSAGPGQVAMDGLGGNSPFAEALARRLRVPGQNLFDAFLGTSDDVAKETAKRQEPWVKFDGAGRTFRELVLLRGEDGKPGASAASEVPYADGSGGELVKAWPAAVLELFGGLQIIEDGRIGSASAYARSCLAELGGQDTVEIRGKNGVNSKLSAEAWLLDTLFRPEASTKYPVFSIGKDAASLVGHAFPGMNEKDTFANLDHQRDKIIQMAMEFEKADASSRKAEETEVIRLAYAIRKYETLVGYMAFGRNGILLKGGKVGSDRRARLSDVLLTSPSIRAAIADAKRDGKELNPNLTDLLQQVMDLANFSKFGPSLLPPSSPSDKEWNTVGTAIWKVMKDEAADGRTLIEDIRALEALQDAVSKPADFANRLAEFRARTDARARAFSGE